MNTPSLVARRVVTAFVVATAIAFTVSLAAQIPSRNVNMVSGLEWPGGDPFVQRQNEPSAAASTRNPMHLLAGSNDYRSVDLAGILGNDNEVGDAWAGLFWSTDGGERWSSTLVPGFPHDPDPRGQQSPIYGYQAAADPVVRAGTNGLMYYSGLAFDRSATGFGKSAIYVARFIDNNNQEAASPFEYIDTSLVATQSASSAVFLDKPWMAVDIPRQGAGTCSITTSNEHGPFTQHLPAGNVYVAFTVKSTDAQGDRWDLYFSRSTDCGVHFSTPMRISRAQDRVNQGASIVISPTTGNVFVSWRRIDLDNSDSVEEHAIVVARSVDKGNQFSNPGVARRFPRGKKKGLNPAGNPGNGKQNTIQASSEFELAPFDQSTSDVDKQFRTNAYPTMTADGTGRLYLAWTERGFASEPTRSDPADGDARILISTSTDGLSWTLPSVVADSATLKGHQLMPALSFAGGKLMMIYYDLQEDRSQVFTKYVDDKTAILQSSPVRRHTFDVRVVTASPGAAPAFAASQSVSSYMMGTRGPTGNLEQLQVNPPNLPMFRLGTVPFIGDYIDLAPSPSFVPTASGGWTYNTAPTTTPPVFHAVWTDNRDVKPPYTLDWRDYTPPNYTGPRPDPGAEIVVCLSGLAGSRNQNIYTARITGGLVVGSPQNSKQLSTTLQRGFVVFAQNTTDSLTPKTFRMTILNQPLNGRASFNQYPLPPFTPSSDPPLTTIDLTIPRFTTASRTVYITSSDPHAQVNVDVSEIPSVGAPGETPGGLEGTIMLNLDVLNPEVDNPEVDNPEVDNPEVDNAEVYNPEVDNPEVDNPEVDNPEVDNPEVDNPEVDNIVVGNPEVDNPEVDNPEVDNPEVDNPEVDNPEVDNGALIAGGGVITDVTWTIKNIGNTTTAYNVNLFLRQATAPSDGRAQLLIYRVYKTPVIKATSCDVKTVTQNVLVANIPDPLLVPPGGQPSDPNDSVGTNGTVWIEPEKEVRVTLRIFDPIKADNVTINGASIDPEWIPEADVSLFAQAQPVNTPDAPTISEPPLVGADPISTFTVTTDADSGAGSLREAMTLAEVMPGLNTIAFNIPSAGHHTIALATLLPTQEESVIIDGSTQPGYAGTPVIEIDGTAIVGGGSGFRLRGGGSTVRGLAIGGFGDHGIWLDNLGSNEVYGNYIGFDVTGTVARTNGTSGIQVNSPNNIVGSLAPGDRNVIGNSSFFGVSISLGGNRVEGNYIGTDVSGAVAAPQLLGVVLAGVSAAGNTISGNLISGNAQFGVAVDGPGNTIEKNRVGVSVAGNVALPNTHGVQLLEAVNNRLIDNVISGNSQIGVIVRRQGPLGAAGTEITGNFIGTDPTGMLAVPNRNGIAYSGVVNTILGGTGAARNFISGNLEEGVYFADEGGAPSTGNVVRGNYIGVASDGNSGLGNGYSGLVILHSSNNTIGGTLPGEGNVISGNGHEGIFVTAPTLPTDNNTIAGNLIGTTANGLNAVPNVFNGVRAISTGAGSISGLRIGGSNAGDGNVISGNGDMGVRVDGAAVIGTLIQGNLIGLGADGVLDLGNSAHGILVTGAATTTIGGSAPGNSISGNGGAGIVATGQDLLIDSNRIGTDNAGLVAVPNAAGGVFVLGAASTNFRVGSLSGNVISGNFGYAGVSVQGSAAGRIERNIIGLNAAGTAAMGNSGYGIGVEFSGVTIVQNNVVSASSSTGIYVSQSDGVVVARNTVGLSSDGAAMFGNGGLGGIYLEFLANALVGGAGAGDGNVVGGNGTGIRLVETTNTNVSGNKVGTNLTGTVARPNSDGIIVFGGSSTGTIGGSNAFTRNIVSGNNGVGIKVVDAGGLSILGNYIGVDAAGTSALPNNSNGIEVQAGTVSIGDPFPIVPNVISGNAADGILVTGGVAGNLIEGNFVGVGEGGGAVPNGGNGIRVTGGRPFIVGNDIANNALNGVTIVGATGVTIATSIYANGGLPIDLGNDGPTANDGGDADAGANDLQNYPSISFAAGSVQGELFSTPNSNFLITAYSGSAVGNARVILGSTPCNTDPAGHCFWGPIAAGGVVSGQVVTATAANAANSTSEFGFWFIVP